MRLIDADAIEYKESRMGTVYQSTDDGFVWREERILEQVSKEDIDEMPTIEAEPVRHGHWIYEPKDAIEMMDTLPKCSECGYESADGLHYCSNCGAKMDLDEVENEE